MKFIIPFLFLCVSCQSQNISGKFMGDLIKNFKFTSTTWYVDGFGSKKMVAIEYTKYRSLDTYKFKSDSYVAWFNVSGSRTYLNVVWIECKFYRYKFNIKKMSVHWK